MLRYRFRFVRMCYEKSALNVCWCVCINISRLLCATNRMGNIVIWLCISSLFFLCAECFPLSRSRNFMQFSNEFPESFLSQLSWIETIVRGNSELCCTACCTALQLHFSVQVDVSRFSWFLIFIEFCDISINWFGENQILWAKINITGINILHCPQHNHARFSHRGLSTRNSSYFISPSS